MWFVPILSSLVLFIGFILNGFIICYSLKKPWNQRTGIDFIVNEIRIGNLATSSLVVMIFYMHPFKSELNPNLNLTVASLSIIFSLNVNISYFLLWLFKYLHIVHSYLMLEISNEFVRNIYIIVKLGLVAMSICIDQIVSNQIRINPLPWSLISTEKEW